MKLKLLRICKDIFLLVYFKFQDQDIFCFLCFVLANWDNSIFYLIYCQWECLLQYRRKFWLWRKERKNCCSQDLNRKEGMYSGTDTDGLIDMMAGTWGDYLLITAFSISRIGSKVINWKWGWVVSVRDVKRENRASNNQARNWEMENY